MSVQMNRVDDYTFFILFKDPYGNILSSSMGRWLKQKESITDIKKHVRTEFNQRPKMIGGIRAIAIWGATPIISPTKNVFRSPFGYSVGDELKIYFPSIVRGGIPRIDKSCKLYTFHHAHLDMNVPIELGPLYMWVNQMNSRIKKFNMNELLKVRKQSFDLGNKPPVRPQPVAIRRFSYHSTKMSLGGKGDSRSLFNQLLIGQKTLLDGQKYNAYALNKIMYNKLITYFAGDKLPPHKDDTYAHYNLRWLGMYVKSLVNNFTQMTPDDIMQGTTTVYILLPDQTTDSDLESVMDLAKIPNRTLNFVVITSDDNPKGLANVVMWDFACKDDTDDEVYEKRKYIIVNNNFFWKSIITRLRKTGIRALKLDDELSKNSKQKNSEMHIFSNLSVSDAISGYFENFLGMLMDDDRIVNIAKTFSYSVDKTHGDIENKERRVFVIHRPIRELEDITDRSSEEYGIVSLLLYNLNDHWGLYTISEVKRPFDMKFEGLSATMIIKRDPLYSPALFDYLIIGYAIYTKYSASIVTYEAYNEHIGNYIISKGGDTFLKMHGLDFKQTYLNLLGVSEVFRTRGFGAIIIANHAKVAIKAGVSFDVLIPVGSPHVIDMYMDRGYIYLTEGNKTLTKETLARPLITKYDDLQCFDRFKWRLLANTFENVVLEIAFHKNDVELKKLTYENAQLEEAKRFKKKFK